ncbi:DUF721 domain-containing protein [Hasllibacter sp. MH4015]|uniref:DUF721 domain-containing protein n=1 Tax=Hasllibacter sp. MH4015 TaxID=2854029 RepID=UPI001CD1B672|nr:DUF721 domain-containing protein [Hasllibacter sp. MH4015]
MPPNAQKSSPDMPRRRRGFERAVTLVGAELRSPAEKRGFAETKLLTHWEEIAGPEIADMAVPVQIRYGRGMGGTLILLTTGAKAPMLEMQKEVIITRVNACYGYSAIKDVHITQTARTGFAEGQVAFAQKAKSQSAPDPARLQAATHDLDKIESPLLRDALRKLAGHIVTNTKV